MHKIKSPLRGQVKNLSEVSDQVFAQGMLGVGVCIIPSEGKVFSPVNGTVATVFHTKHAIAITSDDGVKILIHVGINTVKLGGAGFEAMIEKGSKITAGQLLLEFDMEAIQKAGYSIETPVIITNHKEFARVAHAEADKVTEENILMEIYE